MYLQNFQNFSLTYLSACKTEFLCFVCLLRKILIKEYLKIKEHKNKTRTPFIHEVEVATLCYNRTGTEIFIF